MNVGPDEPDGEELLSMNLGPDEPDGEELLSILHDPDEPVGEETTERRAGHAGRRADRRGRHLRVDRLGDPRRRGLAA